MDTNVHTKTRRFIRLSKAECLDLLQHGGIGRIAFANGPTPVIFPVNFALDRHSIVLRTAASTMINELRDGEGVAFETDSADLTAGLGWSVLATGRIERIVDPGVLAEYEAHEPFATFAPGQRDRWFRIIPARITGRRVV